MQFSDYIEQMRSSQFEAILPRQGYFRIFGMHLRRNLRCIVNAPFAPVLAYVQNIAGATCEMGRMLTSLARSPILLAFSDSVVLFHLDGIVRNICYLVLYWHRMY